MKPACPHLPLDDLPSPGALLALGGARDMRFHLTALGLAQHFWMQGQAGRAVLCLDRAFGCHALRQPGAVMPYRAVVWICRHATEAERGGNFRVHYQHLAVRVRGEGAVLRRLRAWACWHLVRVNLAELAADPRCPEPAPPCSQVEDALESAGLPGEAGEFRQALCR